ncbi:MAG TPA: nickel pincer cofactor biosynthesis protein LarB [Pyrinomonadaceae bacterium]|jgi:NCAIR mutase (PurE)-related protein|nr:nickel pincer cofactor biosynthesis protein LarB [Pyrinomonadaceae bacterium]
MQAELLRELLSDVRNGERTVESAIDALRNLPYEDLGFARLDHHRALRKGFPEVVFCEGKRVEHVVEIMQRLEQKHSSVLATRATREVYDAVAAKIPSARYFEAACMIQLGVNGARQTETTVLIVCAGTADVPVAEEAALTAAALGSVTERLYDVGVAGVHRLLAARETLNAANVIVVVAGMDGALPTLVAGLVSSPVIAAPTSVGYGTGLGGTAALMTMLNACAPGIAVVNIDNGFGAGYMAHLINVRGSSPAIRES